MKFKDFYEIPNFKKLDKVGKTIFVLSFLLPALILYTFLHLYFLPFGLDKNYTLENKEVQFTSTDFFYTTQEDKEVLDGIAILEVAPRIPKRNVITTVSIEGKDSYILKPTLSSDDFLNVWDFEKSFEDEFSYLLLDEYEVEDEDFIAFKLEVELGDWNWWNQLILKHENLRILRYESSFVLRVDEIINHEHRIFTTEYFFNLEEEEPFTLYANYKKANEANGFIELYVNNHFAGRTVIEKEQTEFENMETVWEGEFLKDISQKHVSLKQEEYVAKLEEGIPEELIGTVNLHLYYEKLFKPDIEMQEEEEEYLTDPYFEDVDEKRIQIYYAKEFFSNFLGEVKKIQVGSQYPFEQKKEFSTLFSLTPLHITVVGENSEIEDVKINVFRETVLKKL